MQRRVEVGARGGGEVWWNTWCKSCSGPESLNCTEILLLHTCITLLLSAESKASQLIQLTFKMVLLLHNCHNFYLFI